MAHNNRGRILVDIAGPWKLYAGPLPTGVEPIGTVTRDEGETGTLVRIIATGIYAQLNAGAISSLPQRKVAAALTAAGYHSAGRPAEMEDGRRRNVYVDDASWERALKLGNGNASAGIRAALEAYK